jgi:hypothetical protein
LYFGVLIEGLRNPVDATDPNPVLFVYGDLPAFVPPGSLGTVTISDLLDSSDPGEGWSSDIRRPIGSGGTQSIRLLDTPAGDLGKLLQFDPTEPTWDLSLSVLEAGVVSFQVSGELIQPALGFYWVEEECIEVVAVAPVAMGGGTSDLSYALTVVRGRCGSRDRTHFINPTGIDPGEDPREGRLILWQRPNFSAFDFKGTMYLFDSPYSNTTASVVEAKHFYVTESPTPGIPAYEIKPVDVAEVLEKHVWQLATELQIPYRLYVVSEGVEFVPMPGTAFQPLVTTRKIPAACRLYLDPLRAWQLFGEPVGSVGQTGFDSVLVTGLRNRLTKAGTKIRYTLKITTRKTEWLFEITGLDLLPLVPAAQGEPPLLIVYLSLRDHTKGASLDDEPEETSTDTADGADSDDYPNKVFTRLLTNGRPPRVPLSEEPPTMALWYHLDCNPIDAYLFLTTSNGGYSADPYDALIGVGPGIPSDWQSRGAAPANPLTAPWGTTELLALGGLLSELYNYGIKPGDKLGDFLANLCVLHTLLHAPLTTGELTLIRWARPLDPGVLVSLDPIIDQPVSPGERLTPLRAFLLYSGIKTLTLEPEYVRSITLAGPSAKATAPLSVRVWQPGNLLTDELIQVGTIGHLLRAFFSMMGGTPTRLTVPCHVLRQQLEPGAFVTFSDDRIPTPQGRGFSSVRFVVVGADLNYRTGQKNYRLLRDYYNELPQSLGQIAPTLKPRLPEFVGPLQVNLTLTSEGDASFNALTDHGGIWSDLLSVGGLVHVVNPEIHNPTDQDDPSGWGEAYGTIDSVTFDAGTNRSVIGVSFNAAWVRGNVTLEALFSTSAVVSLVDRRTPASNPEGALIEPIGSQLAGGNDFLTFSSRQSFQRNFSVIG